MEYRIESDSMGEVKVPEDAYWGAQTQRSFENFKIGTEKIPMEVIRAFAVLKKAAAIANYQLGKLDSDRMELISSVCDEIRSGSLDQHFPLAVWQTGSGTQSNMNVNEVIANRGNELAKEKLLHPNDHVNMSQSSNDTFPTAMHIAAVMEIQEQLVPEIDSLISVFQQLEEEHQGIVKTGRTHLQDATPIAFSQEISGWLRNAGAKPAHDSCQPGRFKRTGFRRHCRRNRLKRSKRLCRSVCPGCLTVNRHFLCYRP